MRFVWVFNHRDAERVLRQATADDGAGVAVFVVDAVRDQDRVVGGEHPVPGIRVAVVVERGRIDVEHGDDAGATQIFDELQVFELVADAPVARASECPGGGSGVLGEHVHVREPLDEFDLLLSEVIAAGPVRERLVRELTV